MAEEVATSRTDRYHVPHVLDTSLDGLACALGDTAEDTCRSTFALLDTFFPPKIKIHGCAICRYLLGTRELAQGVKY